MSTPKQWTPVVRSEDMVRELAKRIGHLDRTRPITGPGDLLGPGFAQVAQPLDDWDSAAALFNGFWVSEDGRNAPTDTGTYIGFTVVSADGHGVQVAYDHPTDTTSPVATWTRRVHSHADSIPTFSPWEGTGPEHGVPTGGTILIPSGMAVPTGWLAANGSTQATATYPDLAATLGVTLPTATFTLPNLTAPSGMRYVIKS